MHDVAKRSLPVDSRLRRAMQKADDVLYWLSLTAHVVAALVLAGMVLISVSSVVARNLFRVSLLDAVTPTRIGMVLLVFLAVAWAMREDRHVRVDLIRRLFPHPWNRWVRAAGLAVALVALGVLIYQTLQFALSALRLNEVIFGDIKFPAFPFQASIPLGLTLLALEVLRKLVQDVSGGLGDASAAEDAREAEGD